MYKGRIVNSTAVAVDTNIPFVTVWNTNNNTRYTTNNAVELRAAGYYDVAVNVVLTNATATPVSLQLYNNGQPIEETLTTNDITATTGIETLTIVDTIRVTPDLVNDFAELSVRADQAVTILNGIFTVEMRK